jgi:hypothetical protein
MRAVSIYQGVLSKKVDERDRLPTLSFEPCDRAIIFTPEDIERMEGITERAEDALSTEAARWQAVDELRQIVAAYRGEQDG